jgi:hypothetical protein
LFRHIKADRNGNRNRNLLLISTRYIRFYHSVPAVPVVPATVRDIGTGKERSRYFPILPKTRKEPEQPEQITKYYKYYIINIYYYYCFSGFYSVPVVVPVVYSYRNRIAKTGTELGLELQLGIDETRTAVINRSNQE